MKKIWIAGFISLLGVVTACRKSNIPKQESIQLHQCKDFHFSGSKVKLCFEELVADSRCPLNLMCVWEGVAVASFTFTTEGQSHRFNLATSDAPGPEKTDTIIGGYKIQLLNIEPYPQHPPVHFPQSDVRATVLVTKQ